MLSDIVKLVTPGVAVGLLVGSVLIRTMSTIMESRDVRFRVSELTAKTITRCASVNLGTDRSFEAHVSLVKR
jgi:hypothetical protein